MKNIFKEFKKFAIKGNVIDMAVGIVIGTAFGKIVNSFVDDIIMPPIGVITGGIDFSDLAVTIKDATQDSAAVTLKYGLFVNNIIDFTIIAFSMFIVIKQMNRMKKTEEPPSKSTPEEVLLLREIRDELKRKSRNEKS